METRTLFKQVLELNAQQIIKPQEVTPNAKYKVNSIYVARLMGKAQSSICNEILVIKSKNGNYIDINTGIEYVYKKTNKLLKNNRVIVGKSPLCYVCDETLQEKRIISTDMLTTKQLYEVFNTQQKLWEGSRLSTISD